MSSSNENLGPDPSMDEILSSIRRILKEDERIPHGGERPAPGPGPSLVPPAHRVEPVLPPAANPAGLSQPAPASNEDENRDVFILDPSMMVPDAPARATPQAVPRSAMPPPAQLSQGQLSQGQAARSQAPRGQAADNLLGESAAASASSHLGTLMRTLPSDRALDRGTELSRGGPTLDDIVRDELRPLLRGWLDTNLPGLVERVVRTEIERLVARTKL